MTPSVSWEQKVSLPLLLLGIILLALTLAEPHWFDGPAPANSSVHLGLWKLCGENGTNDCIPISDTFDWILEPQVLECISLTCALASVALSFMMIFQKSRFLCFVAAILANLSGWLGIAGGVVFLHKVSPDEKAWCFSLNVVADVLLIIAGIVLILRFLRTRKRLYETVD